MRKQEIAPCTITKYVAGVMATIEEFQATEKFRFNSGMRADEAIMRFRLIAIQETGEEMNAGLASTMRQAEFMKADWLKDHPEHSDVCIEAIRIR